MEYETDNDEILCSFYPQVRSTFKASEVVQELKKLLDAHQSELLYMPTDYHFLLLHSTLDQWIGLPLLGNRLADRGADPRLEAARPSG